MKQVSVSPTKAPTASHFMPTEKLGKLLNISENGDLGSVIRKARAMGELTHVLCEALPEGDRTAIVSANLRDDGELVVLAASSAWASRLRYETELLIDAARAAGAKITTCRIRVARS